MSGIGYIYDPVAGEPENGIKPELPSMTAC